MQFIDGCTAAVASIALGVVANELGKILPDRSERLLDWLAWRTFPDPWDATTYAVAWKDQLPPGWPPLSRLCAALWIARRALPRLPFAALPRMPRRRWYRPFAAAAAALLLIAGGLVLTLSAQPETLTQPPSATAPKFGEPPRSQPSVTATPPTLADPSGQADGDGSRVVACPASRVCFYAEANFHGPRGTLNDCGWQDLATWGWAHRINSVFYNLNAGAVQFFDQNRKPLFQLDAAARSIRYLGSSGSLATTMYHYC